MRLSFLALPFALLLTAATGCAKSECEKYSDMEWKCGNYPASEEDITRQMSQAMCEGSKAMDEKEDSLGLAKSFRDQAACASKHKDCAGYTACTEAASK